MTAAPAALASTTVEAYGVQATGLVALAKEPDATVATPAPTDVANATLLNLVTLGVLHAAVTQTANSETATSTVASVSSPGLSLLGISTGVITTTCTATAGQTTTGTVSILNGTIGGLTPNGAVAPNTTVTIPLVATVILNEQTPANPGTGDLVVNAIHITLLGGTQDIIIGHAECGPAPDGTASPMASGTGLYLGLGLLGFGGLAFGAVYVRRRRTAFQPV